MTPDLRRSTASRRWLARRLRRLPMRAWGAVRACWRWSFAPRLQQQPDPPPPPLTYHLLEAVVSPFSVGEIDYGRVVVAVCRAGAEVQRLELCGWRLFLKDIRHGKYLRGEHERPVQDLLYDWECEQKAKRRARADFAPLNSAIAQLKPAVKQAELKAAENEAGMRQVLDALRGQS